MKINKKMSSNFVKLDALRVTDLRNNLEERKLETSCTKTVSKTMLKSTFLENGEYPESILLKIQ